MRFGIKKRMIDLGVLRSMAGASRERLARWFAQGEVGQWVASFEHLRDLADGAWISAMLWRQKRSRAVEWALLWAALDWRSVGDATAALDDLVRGRAVASDGQYGLFGDAMTVQIEAPMSLVVAVESCRSYSELQRTSGLSRGNLVYWLEKVPSLRHKWREQVRQRTVDRLLLQLAEAIRSGADWSRVRHEHQLGIAWLREHAPLQYRAVTSGIAGANPSQGRLWPDTR
jgi:hypothetical protein